MKLMVHMVANAHLDPVWLWTMSSGLDEVLATCRSVCDLLDEYPELCFTRGEAWFHVQVQRLAPGLFARVRQHVAAARWQIVNGWWHQPDCNLPTAASFRKHAALGKRYFRETFGVEVTVGYNVDSFGHCATLPMFLREAGMDSYVFMRPGAHEKALPADLFTWKAPSGHSVTAFRVNHAYCTRTVADVERNVAQAVAGANRAVGHTMCFFGLGDHGGGPSREQIEWVRAHREYAPEIELRFSHPRAFFDAVAASGVTLPEYEGELQYHAVGCYSVVHALKQEMRRTENLVVQAEHLLRMLGGEETKSRLEEAWQRILFNQFHDILGGTSILPACAEALDELGLAKTVARNLIRETTRRAVAHLAPAPRQRLVLFNLADRDFRGFVEFEPWLGYYNEKRTVRLTDASGSPVACQPIHPLAPVRNCRFRYVIEANVSAHGRQVLEIHQDREDTPASAMSVKGQEIMNETLAVCLGAKGIAAISARDGGFSWLGAHGVRLAAFQDFTDTWSHRVSSYDGACVGEFSAETPWQVLEQGPLRVTMVNTLRLGEAALMAQVFLQRGEPIVRLRLRLHWQGGQRVVKLLVPAGFQPQQRRDGCPGGEVARPLNGQEYPVHNYVSLSGETAALAVVTADAFAADVQPDGCIRLTLLRCPYYSHHDPFVLPPVHVYPLTDQGVHEYEIALMPMAELSPDAIADEIVRQQKPIWIAETTRGMAERQYPDR